MIAYVLLIIGGLNWGLEFLGWGIGEFLPSGLSNLIYLFVGIAAVYELFTHKNSCRHCEARAAQPMAGQM